MFAVGDRIRVKSYEEIMALTDHERGGFVPGMQAYCGREFSIKEIKSKDVYPMYMLAEIPPFVWGVGCFEKVEEN